MLNFSAKVHSFTMRSRLFAIISVPVFAVLYSITAVGVLIALVFAWLNMKQSIRVLAQLWAKTVFLIMGKRFRVYGQEYINKDSRYILVANHSSLFDIVAIMSFYPGVSWFGHERLLKIPLFGKIFFCQKYDLLTDRSVFHSCQFLYVLVEIIIHSFNL